MGPGLRSGAVRAAVVAGGLAALAVVGWLMWIPTPTPQYFPPGARHAFTSTFDPPTSPIEVAANGGDAQAYAALARDPTLARPEVFYDGAPEAAYRAQRPLAAWIAWVLSGGQPGAVLVVLAGLTVVGVGVFAGAVAALAADLGRRTRAVPALVVAPGVLADIRWLCPDVLGAGLGLLGLVWWRRGRPGRAVLCCTLAALTRETLVLVPLAIGLDALARGTSWRRVVPLAVPFGALGGWLVVVRARLGAWPTDAAGNDRLSLPFAGVARGLAAASPWTIVAALALVAVALAALARRPEPLLARLLVAHLALGAVMGAAVWGTWTGAGRPLLPLVGIAVALLLPAAPASPPVPSPDGRLDAGCYGRADIATLGGGARGVRRIAL